VIIATGASARLLACTLSAALMGHGVSTCATCDGYFFRGHEIASSAAATRRWKGGVLTRFASKVTLVHRRDTLRASKIMQEKARANEIAWMLRSRVEAIHDTGKVRSHVDGRALNKTGAKTEIPVTGVFVAIGHTPNTSLFRGQLEARSDGYIVTDDGAKTTVAGVFACGDVQDQLPAGDTRRDQGACGDRRRALPRQDPEHLARCKRARRSWFDVRRSSFDSSFVVRGSAFVGGQRLNVDVNDERRTATTNGEPRTTNVSLSIPPR